jgi:hypothetical protein
VGSQGPLLCASLRVEVWTPSERKMQPSRTARRVSITGGVPDAPAEDLQPGE